MCFNAFEVESCNCWIPSSWGLLTLVVGVLHQAAAGGAAGAVGLHRGRARDVLELDEVPTSSAGLIPDPLGAASQSLPGRTRKRSAQCPLALQQLLIDCAL